MLAEKYEGFEPISMQQPGGLLRPPVQKLAATILFACGEKAIESLILPDNLRSQYFGKQRKSHPFGWLFLLAEDETSFKPISPRPYITISSATMTVMLITMAMELMALDSPASQPSCRVNTGVAEPMGLKARITRVFRTTRSKGSR